METSCYCLAPTTNIFCDTVCFDDKQEEAWFWLYEFRTSSIINVPGNNYLGKKREKVEKRDAIIKPLYIFRTGTSMVIQENI